MELTPEIIETNKLTPEQVTAISTFGKEHIATLKKEFDEKANTNAEGILTGVVKSVQAKTGVAEERLQGEKYADYLTRISDKFLTKTKTDLEAAKLDYETKLKDFKGGDLLKADLDKAKADYDELLKKTADYEETKKTAGLYEELSKNYNSLKIGTAFRDVKPTFPETVNRYEADAKWNDFEKGILAKYDVEIVDGKAVAIDKENKHRILQLADLVKEDKVISELATGRQQGGTGAKPLTGTAITIEGVPFPIPEKCDSVERSKLIREYLTKEGLDPISEAYSIKFKEYNDKILAKGK